MLTNHFCNKTVNRAVSKSRAYFQKYKFVLFSHFVIVNSLYGVGGLWGTMGEWSLDFHFIISEADQHQHSPRIRD